VFDDPSLVSHAGLVPVMALAERAGLPELLAEYVRPGGECGANAPLKVGCLVHLAADHPEGNRHDGGVPSFARLVFSCGDRT
jgi:hypothetical protein